MRRAGEFLRLGIVVGVLTLVVPCKPAAGHPGQAGRPDELDKTIAAGLAALRENSGEAETYLRLSGLLRRANRADEAVDLLRRGLAVFPDAVPIRAELARTHLDRGQFEEAIRAIEPVWFTPEGASLLAEIHFSRGREAFAAQNFFESLVSARRAVALEPGNPEYQQLEGASYFALGQTTDARKRFEQVIRLDPDHTAAYFSLALIHLRGHDLESAEAHLVEATTRQPGFAAAHFHLGRVYNLRNRSRLAVDEFRRALDAGGDFEDLFLHLGSAYKALGLNALAIEALEEQVARDPESAVARLMLGDSYMRTRRWDEARRHLEETIQLEPDQARAHLLLGRALLELGRDEEALASLRQCVAADPESEAPHYLMRQIYLRQGKLDLARQETESFTHKKRMLEYLERKHAEGTPGPD